MTVLLRVGSCAVTVPDELQLTAVALSPTEAELRLRIEPDAAAGEWAPRLRATAAPRADGDQGQRMARLLGTLRVQLTDSVVVEAAPFLENPTLGESWQAVVAFRTGLIAQTMYLLMADIEQSQLVLFASCVAEESEFFGPYFRAIALGMDLDTGSP